MVRDKYRRLLANLRLCIIGVNLLNILFYGAVILLTTKYIVDNELSREFLTMISYMPRNPLLVFFGALFLYAVLVCLIYFRTAEIREHKVMNSLYSFLELVICFLLIYLFYMDYNGFILLVFCDCIYCFKDDKHSMWLLAAFLITYLFTSYDVFSSFVPMTNLEQYFQIQDSGIKGTLMVMKSVLGTLNLLFFIVFIIVYIAAQLAEQKNTYKKLARLLTVNRELKDYASVTEKIGENNERKRLAREIHDTVGHALAGIAAGVDACIVMIDKNPQATKQQLQVISKVVRKGMGDVRNSLNKLRPGVLEKHGLKSAIETMIEEFSSVSKIDICLNYKLEDVDFETTKENVLFRTIQESITNALRHGAATHIDIDIYQEAQTLCLRIKDNGVGCEMIQYGFGLKQMQERIAIINGNVNFDGSDGFLIMVKIPMERGEYRDEGFNCR